MNKPYDSYLLLMARLHQLLSTCPLDEQYILHYDPIRAQQASASDLLCHVPFKDKEGAEGVGDSKIRESTQPDSSAAKIQQGIILSRHILTLWQPVRSVLRRVVLLTFPSPAAYRGGYDPFHCGPPPCLQ